MGDIANWDEIAFSAAILLQCGGERCSQGFIAAGADINIVAIHQHMTGETPRMIFLDYYGREKALTLAKGVKAAIDTQPNN